MISPELQELIAEAPYTQATIQRVAALLPAEEAALDALLAECVSRSDSLLFVEVVTAALLKGRAVAGRHLERGAALLENIWHLGAFACHMEGEVSAPLIAAITSQTLPFELVSSAIYLAAYFFAKEHGGRLPAALISAARTAARNKANQEYDKAMLHAVALLAGDGGLTALVLEAYGVRPGDARIAAGEKAVQMLAEQMLVNWRRPPIDLVPTTERRAVAEGETMRRSTPRVGRNDKCPCGSGRKYKQCCIHKDAERLAHSTSIAGVTDLELRANPERYLTALSLGETPGTEAARFDPRKIDPALHEPFLACLCRARLYERCVEVLEIYGVPPALEEAWENIAIRAAQARRKDLVDRLLKLRPEEAARHSGSLALFLHEEDPARLHEMLTHQAMFLLKDETDPSKAVGFARSLLRSPLCAIGILIVRGLLPILPREEAAPLLAELLETRDRLNLSPNDPISDVMDHRFLEQRAGTSREANALREVQQRLNDKLLETRRFRENIERLERELARREQLVVPPPTAAPASAAPTPETDEGALRELRRKVSDLRSALTERHQERNALRRELQEAHAALDDLRHAPGAPPAAPGEEVDHEEDWLLPQEAEGNQPVRVIEFPKAFRDSLASLPKSVARGTLTMLGRLAAGDPSAFVGAVRLKACPEVTRQRIGIDFRLLVRLHPDRVEVVDLIPRQDLERRIKTLARR